MNAISQPAGSCRAPRRKALKAAGSLLAVASLIASALHARPEGAGSTGGDVRASGGSDSAFALSSAFTYAGRLDRAGELAEGAHDFHFELWSQRDGGELLGSITRLARPVQAGVFREELDFGPAIHDSAEAWLQIEVRDPGDAAFTPLTPRQRVSGGGSVCTVPGDVQIEGRLAVNTDVSTVGQVRVQGPEATSDGTAGTLVVSTGLGLALRYLQIDGDEIDSWNPFASGNRLHLNSNTGSGVSVGTFETAGALQVVGGGDAGPGGGGALVLGSATGGNLALDGNEIMARNNGAVAPLFVQHNGGDLIFGAGPGGGQGRVEVNGVLDMGWEIVANEAPDQFVSAFCPVGKKVLGGGCFTEGSELLESSAPFFTNGQYEWYCAWDDSGPGDVWAYAICANVD
mgnify:CR=1 FL=1